MSKIQLGVYIISQLSAVRLGQATFYCTQNLYNPSPGTHRLDFKYQEDPSLLFAQILLFLVGELSRCTSQLTRLFVPLVMSD